MIGARQRTARSMRHKAALMLLANLLLLLTATAWGATEHPSVTWTTKADFEQATRTNLDTTTKVDSVIIQDGTKDFVTSATITCITSGKIYTTGVDRTTVAVIDAQTREVLRTIGLPGRAAGAVFNTANKKLYIGQYEDNKVSVIDTTTDSVRVLTLTQGTPGKGAFAAAYNPVQNKVYIANTSDSTITVLDGLSDSELVTKKVTAGATTASFDAGKLYLTSKTNDYVTVVDGATDEVVENVEITQVQNILGGQAPGNVGLRVADAAALGITAADRIKLSWSYECAAKDQMIQFQARVADDASSLDPLQYEGPSGESSWYQAVCPDRLEGIQKESAYLDIPFKNATELQVRLVADGLSSPTLHDVTLTYESFPDLAVANASATSTALSVGASLTVNATIQNLGRVKADASLASLTLVNDNGFSLLLTGEPVPPLDPAQGYPIASTFAVPEVSYGNYYIKVCADSGAAIEESNEDNNCTSIPVSVTQADLVVTELNFPASAVIGSSVQISSTVSNVGGVAAGQSTTKLFLSKNGTDTAIQDVPVPALAPGAVSSANSTVVIPNVPTGTYNLKACADYTGQVTELDEDNCVIGSGTIDILATQADLVVTNVSGSVTAGKLTYSVTVKNYGKLDAALKGTGIYLSVDSDIQTTDIYVTNKYDSYNTLASGRSITYNGSADVPVDVTGTYYIGAYADYAKETPEADEQNNSMAGNQVTITNDLVMVSGSVSGSVAGGRVSYAMTVANNGNGRASLRGAGVYLSTDSDIQTSDMYISNKYSYSALAGGSSVAYTGICDAPVDFMGTYYIGAYADYAKETPEADEQNNSMAGNQVTITNDLVILAGSVSGSVSGGKVSYAMTVANNGNGRASLRGAGVYLSTDSDIQTSDMYISNKYSYSALAGGSSVAYTGICDAPVDFMGTYYIGAYADYAKETPEADEQNNSMAGNQVTITNDLVIVAGSVSGSVSDGKVSYAMTVANNGNGRASLRGAGVYLSIDSDIGTSDMYIANKYSYSALAGGSSVAYTGICDAPVDFTGTYYIGAYADYSNETPEDVETNNGLAGNQVTL